MAIYWIRVRMISHISFRRRFIPSGGVARLLRTKEYIQSSCLGRWVCFNTKNAKLFFCKPISVSNNLNGMFCGVFRPGWRRASLVKLKRRKRTIRSHYIWFAVENRLHSLFCNFHGEVKELNFCSPRAIVPRTFFDQFNLSSS